MGAAAGAKAGGIRTYPAMDCPGTGRKNSPAIVLRGTSLPIREGIPTLNMKNQLPLYIEGDHLAGTFLVFYPGAYSLSIVEKGMIAGFRLTQIRFNLPAVR